MVPWIIRVFVTFYLKVLSLLCRWFCRIFSILLDVFGFFESVWILCFVQVIVYYGVLCNFGSESCLQLSDFTWWLDSYLFCDTLHFTAKRTSGFKMGAFKAGQIFRQGNFLIYLLSFLFQVHFGAFGHTVVNNSAILVLLTGQGLAWQEHTTIIWSRRRGSEVQFESRFTYM